MSDDRPDTGGFVRAEQFHRLDGRVRLLEVQTADQHRRVAEAISRVERRQGKHGQALAEIAGQSLNNGKIGNMESRLEKTEATLDEWRGMGWKVLVATFTGGGAVAGAIEIAKLIAGG